MTLTLAEIEALERLEGETRAHIIVILHSGERFECNDFYEDARLWDGSVMVRPPSDRGCRMAARCYPSAPENGVPVFRERKAF